MFTASLALSLVALAATVEGSFQAPLASPATVLAQEGAEAAPPPSAEMPPETLPEMAPKTPAPPAAAPPSAEIPPEDTVGDAPPPLEAPPAVTPPPGARVVPQDETPGPRARMEERRRKKQAEPDGLDPMLTRALQVGVGAVTCGACGLGYCGASLAATFGVGLLLAPILIAVPILSPIILGGIDLVLCSGLGATVGAVEVGVGNLFGQEEGSYLWPALAGAGLGAGVAAIGAVIGVILATMNAGTPAPQPGEPDPRAFFAFTNPIALALSVVSLGVCAAGCVAMPIVPALVYGLTAEPKVPTGLQVDLYEPRLPKADAARTAMAY